MKTVHFTARLLADAVISERAATTGGHRSLDHIPGACLLGAAAARLYRGLDADAFTVFHSGKVRFGNAYPLDSADRPTLPVPFAWHASKGEDLKGSVASVKNLLHASEDQFREWDRSGDQQKQLRSGFFSAAGELVQPEKRYRLKTAIDRKKMGMAEEAQLFGYEALAAGSLWHFSVAFDADVPEVMVEQVSGALSGRIRIGRSRSAEYGLLEAQPIAYEETCTTGPASDRLILYCASDLALADPETGVSVLTPAARHFDLAGATFQPQTSYLRVRGYAPFNAARRRFDLERQVITRGSVLVFTKDGGFGAADIDSVARRVAGGVGLHRQDGLGRILVNPPFLAGFKFTAETTASALPAPAPVAAGDLPSLAGWLKAKAGEQAAEVAAIEQAERWIEALLSGSPPKNSQWGNLRNAGLRADSVDKIRGEAKKLCAGGVTQKQWEKKFSLNGKKISYGQFILETVLPEGIALEEARRRLYLLGNRLPRRVNQKEGGER